MDSPPRKKSPGRKATIRKMSPAQKASPRKASPSRKASPGRRASPGRNISFKEKTPSAIKVSPRRLRKVSPARLRKESPSRSPSRRIQRNLMEITSTEIIKPVSKDSKEISDMFIEEEREVVRNSRERSRSSSLMKSTADSTLSSITVRRSTRILAVKEEELKDHMTTELEPEEKEVTTVFENTDMEYKEKSEPVQLLEFGGTFGTLFWLFFSPAFLIALHIYSKYLREGSSLVEIASNWRNYFDTNAAVLYIIYFSIQFVLSVLPIGSVASGLPDKMGCLKYRLNGFQSCLLTLALLGVLSYYQFHITIVLEKLIQMLVFSQIFGLVISFILFMKGGNVPVAALNPHGNTGNKIYDFFIGREINPRFRTWDIKMTLLKTGVIGAVIVNILIAVKGYEETKQLSPTLLFVTGMQLFYYLDYLWHESCLLASFEIMYEGTGAMAVLGYAMLPFFSTLITKYILDYRVELHGIVLCILCLLHTLGYVIYRASNNQKSEFRKNPLNPIVNYLETIPTTRGRKLIVSGWWGWVRHPNYLGDILMQWTWVSACGLSHWLPYVVPISTTLFILHRIWRNETRCHMRYNSAWDMYCKRVPSRLIPKVF